MIIAPEILDALEGRLAIKIGEIAACLDFFKPSYPKSISDFLDYAGHPLSANMSFSGSVNFDEPLYLEYCDTYVFRVEKYVNSRARVLRNKEELERFICLERKGFFSPNRESVIPSGYKLCFCVVALKRPESSTIAIASVAKRENP